MSHLTHALMKICVLPALCSSGRLVCIKTALFKVSTSLFSTIYISFFVSLLFLTGNAGAQAPVISYAGSQLYRKGITITPLIPVNRGGVVPVNSYGQVTTFAGQANVTGSTDGRGSAASFNSPYGLTTDLSGNIYVADQGNQLIRRINPAGVVTSLAGQAGAHGALNGQGSTASFNDPSGLGADASGTIYIADLNNNEIRKVNAAGVVTTLKCHDGTSNPAIVYSPGGLATDASGNVYVSEINSGIILKIDQSGLVTTLAGHAGAGGAVNGTGGVASFYFPFGLAAEASGNVYVADTYNQLIRRISPAGVVTTLAGQAGVMGAGNGDGASASFNYPTGVSVDAAGNVFVADAGNNLIRKISPEGMVTTVAGTAGVSGSADGSVTTALFSSPSGTAVDGSGNLYIADQGNNLIRKIIISGYSISPLLSAGLLFDPFTGIISGTPSVTAPPVTYTVTACNLSGSSSATISITVFDSIPVPEPAVISTNGIPSALSTLYGSPSAATAFTIAGSNLIQGILVTAPSGFEVSTGNDADSRFSQSVTVGVAGTIALTTVYIRLAEGNQAGTYSGTILLSSGASTTAAVPMAQSTVNRVPLTVTVTNARVLYGTAIPPPSISYTGFVNSESVANLTAPGMASTTAVTGSEAGAYVINITGAADSNYAITIVSGSLTIVPAPLTIIASDLTKYAGSLLADSLGVTGFTETGLIGSETIGSISLTYRLGAGATAGSGIYAGSIIPSKATGGTFTAANYSITYRSGTLTVKDLFPVVITLAASRIKSESATIGGIETDREATATLSFQYGTDSTLTGFMTAAAGFSMSPLTSGSVKAGYSGMLKGLSSATTYYYRFTGTNSAGTGMGTILSFRTPGTDANLAELNLGSILMTETFNKSITAYTAIVESGLSSVNLSLLPEDVAATATVDGNPFVKGASIELYLNQGINSVPVIVTAEDGITQMHYSISIQRKPDAASMSVANLLSPNGDGQNDTWVVRDILKYPRNKVTVYDRQGRTVFTKTGYTNDWGGTLQGRLLKEDTYYYLIDYGPGERKARGFISLVIDH